MSWGERSCVWYGQSPKPCHQTQDTCNVDCSDYKWDGVTAPDSVDTAAHFINAISSPAHKAIYNVRPIRSPKRHLPRQVRAKHIKRPKKRKNR